MKFEEVYGRTRRGVLGQAEAAEIWASRIRRFALRRKAQGLYDRRLGRLSTRAPVDEVARVLELFDTRYTSAKHFEKLVASTAASAATTGCG